MEEGCMIPRWEHFEHQADVGVRGLGRTPAEAFEQAAMALTATAVDPGGVDPVERVTITCEAPDLELLLVDWLSRVVCEMSARRMLFSRFEVRIEGTCLSASAWGERVAPERHHPAVEVKGVTYHQLRVAADAEGVWTAQCVVDV
jgi:SHS2 domain-containing protein